MRVPPLHRQLPTTNVFFAWLEQPMARNVYSVGRLGSTKVIGEFLLAVPGSFYA